MSPGLGLSSNWRLQTPGSRAVLGREGARGARMICIKLFGVMSASVDGRIVAASELGGRPRQVLELLALDAGKPVAKDRLAEQLWEGAPPASYIGTLESYISLLRRILGVGAGRGSVLATVPGAYVLAANDVTVDLHEFHELVASSAKARGTGSVKMSQRALQLLDGPLLAQEPYAAWAVQAREAFRHELVAACVRAAQMANGVADFSSAEQFARSAIEHDPLCEAAWRHLMRAYWFSGRRADALRTYSTLREALLEELGDEPGQDSQQLYFAILRDGTSPHGAVATGSGFEVRALLDLLRQALDVLPGVQAP